MTQNSPVSTLCMVSAEDGYNIILSKYLLKTIYIESISFCKRGSTSAFTQNNCPHLNIRWPCIQPHPC